MIKMKKVILFLSLLLVFTLSGCEREDNYDVTIYTTLYPQYDIVNQLVGDMANVEYLLPPGTSAHSYEPSPQTMISIINSDLFIYTGDILEPWVEGMLEGNDTEELKVIGLSNHINLIDTSIEHHHEEDEHDAHDEDEDDHDHDVDPHFWSDPDKMSHIVIVIKVALLELFDDSELINERADEYIAQMTEMDILFQDLADHRTNDYLMHGGHNSIGYFVNKYDLEYVNPYDGFSTDAEPTPQAIANMIDVMEEHNIEYLFSEKLISQTVSTAISEQTGAEILYIYSMGNVSSDDFNAGITIYEMMQHNLEQYKIGLGYDGTN